MSTRASQSAVSDVITSRACSPNTSNTCGFPAAAAAAAFAPAAPPAALDDAAEKVATPSVSCAASADASAGASEAGCHAMTSAWRDASEANSVKIASVSAYSEPYGAGSAARAAAAAKEEKA